MSRLFAITLLSFAFATQASAADPVPVAENAPEKLLSPTSQLYVRWDGITAHADTYKKSFWGPLMAGPSGDSVRALLAKLPKLLGNRLLAEPLLDGKPPAELRANLTDLKNASKLIDLLADNGVVVGAEVREPAPSLKALGSALGSLLGGERPGVEALMPALDVFIVIPDTAEKSETFFATHRLMLGSDETKIEPFTIAGRKGFRAKMRNGPLGSVGPRNRSAVVEDPPAPASPFDLQAAWWTEGKHFVLYIGTRKAEEVVPDVIANQKKNGLAAHPLFARCSAKQTFNSVARGFADTGKVISMVKSLAGPFVPGLNQRIDELGLGGLKAVLFNCGYDGREFRAVWEADIPGERKGLAAVHKRDKFGLADLPPLPTDVSRFVGIRIDPKGAYDAGLTLIETLAMNESFGAEDDAKTPAEKIRLRREYLAKEFDKLLGIGVRSDILPCLGDKLVVYQSPNEGLSIFGTVICVSLKDPAKAKAIAERVHTGIENLLSAPVKVRKKMLKGVEIRELYSRGFGFVTPTYAIVDDWLVISIHPQGVQGFVLRAKGDLPGWKPDAATLARLKTLPTDGFSLQYCDPTTTVKNMCCIGPLILGTFGLRDSFNNDNTTDFDPIDIGLIPNAHELSKHLFPNLTVIRDDGKTIRLEVNESLSVPLEVIGLEPLIFAGMLRFIF